MASYYPKADIDSLKPGVFVGKHPDTGVIHRLTITGKQLVKIERQPYVSDNPDGWIKHYEIIDFTDALKHTFLIEKIKQNPVVWPE